ncbi:hypothetical protein [Marinobacter sp.]|uniref:hypothetical protein n=1 Tax=Marinobacter sp. TaxID=50741 RepID=UPI001B630E6A|nr:hypothetical protein [Marinobacter sp.]MBQ0832068.1 hypothetical protein [Marinobacter sp.]
MDEPWGSSGNLLGHILPRFVLLILSAQPSRCEIMEKDTDQSLLFEVNNPQETEMLEDLHNHFNGMFFAN